MEDDPSLIGNLLVERMVGVHVSLVSKEEYVKYGSVVSLCLIFVSCFSLNIKKGIELKLRWQG